MPTIEKSIIINAPADQVWNELAHKFDSIGGWASGLDGSAVLSSAPAPVDASVGGRVCQAPGFGEVKEVFTRFSEKNMSLAYKVEGLPSFVADVENSWQVSAMGDNKTKATMKMKMSTKGIGKLMGPMMSMQLKKQINAMQADLKHYIETGTISEAKKKANAKLAKKGTVVQSPA